MCLNISSKTRSLCPVDHPDYSAKYPQYLQRLLLAKNTLTPFPQKQECIASYAYFKRGRARLCRGWRTTWQQRSDHLRFERLLSVRKRVVARHPLVAVMPPTCRLYRFVFNRPEVSLSRGLFGLAQDIYQACRGWTIATFQHVTEDEFLIRFMGRSVGGWTVYEEGEDIYDDDFFFGASSRRKLSSQNRRELLYTFESYDDTADPSADVFVAVAMTAAFESALPATLRIVGEGYVSTAYDHMLLSAAAEDVPGLFEDNEINVGDVLRGAVLSPAMAVGPHYSEVVSNLSPRFKLPVDAIQRGRDHGVPSYNAVREVMTFNQTWPVTADRLELTDRSG